MKKELGKWFMDLAKYVATAVILSSIFSGLNDGYAIILLGVFAMLVMLTIGLWLVYEPKKKNKNRK